MSTLPALTLVIGGAASGKSDFAESLAMHSTGPRHYIATAQAFDAEMTAKIERHKAARADAGWQTIEEPLAVADALAALTGGVILIDCATLWLSNLMMNEADIADHTNQLIEALAGQHPPIVIVSNEVGHGVVPDNKLARVFREEQGVLNRKLAAKADLVVQVTVGIPHVLKGTMPDAAT